MKDNGNAKKTKKSFIENLDWKFETMRNTLESGGIYVNIFI